MSVVSDGSQLALLIVFCRDFNQPVAQLAVSGSLCVHTRSTIVRWSVWCCCAPPLQVLPSLVINTMSLLYSMSLFVTVAWCTPTHDEVGEFRRRNVGLYDRDD